jgi:hypothetical protein
MRMTVRRNTMAPILVKYSLSRRLKSLEGEDHERDISSFGAVSVSIVESIYQEGVKK